MAIWEIAVATRDFGEGRVQAGDIIAARTPLGFIGKKEGKNFLWVSIETDLTREELVEQDEGPEATEKRRRKIDLTAFCAEEGLDKARMENPRDEYQPLLGKAPHFGKFKHIKDKTGEFLPRG